VRRATSSSGNFPSKASSSGFQISGGATQPVTLRLSTNLDLWTPLYTNFSPTVPLNYLDTNSVRRTRGFYRLAPWP